MFFSSVNDVSIDELDEILSFDNVLSMESSNTNGITTENRKNSNNKSFGSPHFEITDEIQEDAPEEEYDLTRNHQPCNLNNNIENINILNSFTIEDPMSDMEIIDENNIPLAIVNLFKYVKSELTDWYFIRLISGQMCKDILPMYSFIHLKSALLLSIASIQECGKQSPIPILAIGRESSIINSIMNNIGNYAQRFITPLHEFSYNQSENSEFIEADPVILASGGVCYTGEWIRLKSCDSMHIQRILDKCEIQINKTDLLYPLETAIWSQWDCLKPSKRDYSKLQMFLNTFGIPIVVQEEDALQHELLIDFILEKSVDPDKDKIPESLMNIGYEDMKQYLYIVGNRTVTMSDKALTLLNNYFIVTRMNREPGVLTQRGFIILKQLAESYAKLCLRVYVLECDVIAAICIAEKYITEITGTGLIMLNSMNNNEPYKLSNNMDANMDEFSRFIKDYIELNMRSTN